MIVAITRTVSNIPGPRPPYQTETTSPIAIKTARLALKFKYERSAEIPINTAKMANANP
jgi:hypothetical protein